MSFHENGGAGHEYNFQNRGGWQLFLQLKCQKMYFQWKYYKRHLSKFSGAEQQDIGGEGNCSLDPSS